MEAKKLKPALTGRLTSVGKWSWRRLYFTILHLVTSHLFHANFALHLFELSLVTVKSPRLFDTLITVISKRDSMETACY